MPRIGPYPGFPSRAFRSILPYGSQFGSRESGKINRFKKYSNVKKGRANRMDLHGYDPSRETRTPASRAPIDTGRFLYYFRLFYVVLFAFRYSFKALSPYVPHRSVAETVVKTLPTLCWKRFPGWGAEHFRVSNRLDYTSENRIQQVLSPPFTAQKLGSYKQMQVLYFSCP